MKQRNKYQIIINGVAALSLLLIGSAYSLLRAEETVIEKGATKVDEVKKNVKKDGRKIKREVRDVTGNSSTKENIKDSMKNTGDEVEYQTKKLKRKID